MKTRWNDEILRSREEVLVAATGIQSVMAYAGIAQANDEARECKSTRDAGFL